MGVKWKKDARKAGERIGQSLKFSRKFGGLVRGKSEFSLCKDRV